MTQNEKSPDFSELSAVWLGRQPGGTRTTRPTNVKQNEKSPDFSELSAVWTGLEPATPCVTGMYSNQLNYQTIK
jgi:hypothetical protein